MAKRKRTYNTNLIKRTVSYSTYEIAELFGLHKATVRQWYKEGLKRIDNRRPFLVNGADLEIFIKNRQKKRKQKCKLNELYCCSCRKPQKALNNEVILVKHNGNIGRLVGLCLGCGSKTNKMISLKKFERYNKILTILKTDDKNLIVLDSPNVNTDLEGGVST